MKRKKAGLGRRNAAPAIATQSRLVLPCTRTMVEGNELGGRGLVAIHPTLGLELLSVYDMGFGYVNE